MNPGPLGEKLERRPLSNAASPLLHLPLLFACCKNAKLAFHLLPDGEHRFQQKFSFPVEVSLEVVALGVGLHMADEVLEGSHAHRPQVDRHHGPDASEETLNLEPSESTTVART